MRVGKFLPATELPWIRAWGGTMSSPHYWGVRGAKAARQTEFDAIALH
jgi:hypothetical protein